VAVAVAAAVAVAVTAPWSGELRGRPSVELGVRGALLLVVASCAAGPKPATVRLPEAPVAAPTPPAPARAVTDEACEAVKLPPMGGVVVLDRATFGRAMAPVVHAVCACTRPGDAVRVVATLTPEEGAVVARVPDAPAADRCVQNTINGRYPAFTVGSDCIDCGPRRYGVFRGSPPPEPPPATKLVYSFRFVHTD
jgi:hypothetical protein